MPIKMINFQEFPWKFPIYPDKICLKNIFQQICKQFDTISFNTWFIFSSDQHNYETSRQCNIKSSCRTNKYGKYSIIASAVDLWNKVQK